MSSSEGERLPIRQSLSQHIVDDAHTSGGQCDEYICKCDNKYLTKNWIEKAMQFIM